MNRQRMRKTQQQATQNSVSSNLAPFQSNIGSNQLSSQNQSPQISSDNAFHFNGAERIHYLENLVSKQFDLYTWCE